MTWVPRKCPRCGKPKDWIEAGKARKGFSFFKAIIGAIIFWPIGLLAGLLGKNVDYSSVNIVVLVIDIKPRIKLQTTYLSVNKISYSSWN